MLLRPRCPLILAMVSLGLGACAGSAQSREETAEAVKTGRRPSSEDAVIVSRSAPVPEVTDPNERIVFLRAGSVWMMGANGESPEQLTVRALEAGDLSPEISPDGRMLAYASAKEGNQQLYLQSMEDMIPLPLTDGEGGGDDHPSWSRDSTHLVFMRGDARERRDVFLMEAAEGAEPRLVLEGDDHQPEEGGHPIFLPDGKTLLLGADRREHQGTTLWSVDIQSGHLKRFTPGSKSNYWIIDKQPALSPDGKRIVFASNRHATSADDADDFDLYSIGIDGSGLSRLTDDPGTVDHPCFSPDGKRVYFSSTRLRDAGFEWEIFVMASQGGTQKRLTRDPRPQNNSPSAASVPALDQ